MVKYDWKKKDTLFSSVLKCRDDVKYGRIKTSSCIIEMPTVDLKWTCVFSADVRLIKSVRQRRN